jgi:2-keto-4-pentenoate hydratase/2-oxohepta-3-ene-1,7-dioic acid hydratase in catechol pathway
MKRVRFRDPGGTERTGRWIDDDGTSAANPGADGQIVAAGTTYDPEAVTLLPPCEPTKVVCIGLNYQDHAAERDATIPDRPMLFLKPPNAVTGPDTTVPLLPDRDRIDYEAELGVVIGEQCRNLDRGEAMDAVAGFTCVNDVSNREDQDREQNWVRGKAFDGAAPMGPVVADPAHVPDDASVELRVNGDLRQSSSRDQLIFDVPDLLVEITAYLTLEPGDVVSTGTPAGVGPLSPGDHVAVTVEGVGTLHHDVAAPR